MAKTVLIVEDNELNMKLFNDLLEAHGYQTVQTRNGVEAVELARKHHPDLILMDIQLPEVSGLQVTQWIKDDETLRDIPVIAVTAEGPLADDMADLQERVQELGAETLLLTNMPNDNQRRRIRYPATAEWVSPIVAIAAAQPAIHRLTVLRGLDPDAPRTISKVTRTV